MDEQYFTDSAPASADETHVIDVSVRGFDLSMRVSSRVFSGSQLDLGTRQLLSVAPDLPEDGTFLDLGCGWGAIGVAVKKKYPAAHVTMVDVNRRALELCRFNAVRNGITAECLESDGMAEVMERTFDFIITNPPIRASKPVIYRMFADAASRLNPGGALYLVIRKQQGAESCMKYLKTLYAKVDKVDKSGGFWVLRATEPLKKENEAQEEAADAHV